MLRRKSTKLGGALALFTTAVISAGPTHAATETILHSFTGGSDGAYPNSGLLHDESGTLFGTTMEGGTGPSACQDISGANVKCGTVFMLTPPPRGKTEWTETVLHSFSGGDGRFPNGNLILGECEDAWRDSTRWRCRPDRPFERPARHVLYGTTTAGGTANMGTVFKLTPPNGGETDWTETVIYNFKGGRDGSQPSAVIADDSGALYGTTPFGGTAPSSDGNGTVFKLTPPATDRSEWTKTVLHSFTGGIGDSTDGATPNGGLVFDRSGAIYGTTNSGGTGPTIYDDGTVFKLRPSANGIWHETVLLSFIGIGAAAQAGAFPNPGLIIDDAGALFGTTSYGGDLSCAYGFGCGVVFELSPPRLERGDWTESVLYAFKGYFTTSTDGGIPLAGVVRNGSGILYGTTAYGGSTFVGTAYELSPPATEEASWTETILYSFLGLPQDGVGSGAAILDRRGVLYGTTASGGANNFGTVFEVRP
jgi:uncharacterized repeat protein (TIGR03803 family)